jgi:hypothetical protein
VLWLYEQFYDPEYPVVCMDERPCFLIDNVLTPVPMEEGKPKREHYEYAKNGSCTVFIAVEPLTGQRFIQVYKQRTGKEYVQFMEYVASHYPAAKKIRIVQDNLSTHSQTMFYAHLKPAKAFALTQRFEMHYTPAKSSWLNMAEIELSALARQCLKRRIGTQEKLEIEVKAWVKARNKAKVKIKWQFTVNDARETFKNKYPLEQRRLQRRKEQGV